MADNLNVYKYCERCKGTGEVVSNQPPQEGLYTPVMVTCNRCDGEGKHLWGIMLEEEDE